jgi:hypothetical protein
MYLLCLFGKSLRHCLIKTLTYICSMNQEMVTSLFIYLFLLQEEVERVCQRLLIHEVTFVEILDLEQICWHRCCKYFLGKEHLVNNRLISTLDKVIYLKGRIFSKVYETSLHKIGWRPADKKIARSFNMCVLGLKFLWWLCLWWKASPKREKRSHVLFSSTLTRQLATLRWRTKISARGST